MDREQAAYFKGELLIINRIEVQRVYGFESRTEVSLYVEGWPPLVNVKSGTRLTRKELAELFTEMASAIEKGPPDASPRKRTTPENYPFPLRR